MTSRNENNYPLLPPKEALRAWANGERIQCANSVLEPDDRSWIKVEPFHPSGTFSFTKLNVYRRHVDELRAWISIPLPMRETPAVHTPVFIAAAYNATGFVEMLWDDSDWMHCTLKSGSVFDTGEKAAFAGKAWSNAFGIKDAVATEDRGYDIA